MRTSSRLSNALTENADDLANFVSTDPRGKQIEPYLHAVADHLRKRAGGHHPRGRDRSPGGIEHIRELINSQQGFAKRTGFTEQVRTCPSRSKTALNISNRALAADGGLTVDAGVRRICLRRSTNTSCSRFIVNLIQNARQAMQVHRQEILTWYLASHPTTDGRFRIEVSDNGIGILGRQPGQGVQSRVHHQEQRPRLRSCTPRPTPRAKWVGC